MSADIQQWIAIADGGLETAQRELRARKNPNYNSACFHSQQCAEKYLKGFMVQNEIPFRKIHDLRELSEAILVKYPEFNLISDLLAELNPLAVATRYPGYNATRELAKDAVRATRQVRAFIRSRMGLPTEK